MYKSSAASKSPRVCFLGDIEMELQPLMDMLDELAIVKRIRDLSTLDAALKDSQFDMVFCLWSFEDGTWMDVVQSSGRSSPEVPVIVVSRSGSEKKWVQVLAGGGFDLLVPPYRSIIVAALMEQARTSRDARVLANHAAI